MSRLGFNAGGDFQQRIASGDALLRLYAILDAESCERRGLPLLVVAEAWRNAGVRLLQYRDKQGSDATVVANALALRDLFAGTGAILILNDRVPLFAASGFQGVHVGQTDESLAVARATIGPDAILGVSTHTPEQVKDAEVTNATYIAIGPVYGTQTKLDAAAVVGLEGVYAARQLTRKPLVAIGGITTSTAAAVRESGADSVAIISALFPQPSQALNEPMAEMLQALSA
jgi:thiamine-phosphate pyrophosphorylase